MSNQSPLSPERRARASKKAMRSEARWFHRLTAGKKILEIAKRVLTGVFTVGFLHAGNFAYMSLIALFAFFIIAASVGGLLGSTDFGIEFIRSFLSTVPPNVAKALRAPIESAITARSGPVLWLSALVGLWTTGSLIETIREIQHAAYGTSATRPFWRYRLTSIIVIIGAVLLAIIAFSTQFMLVAATELLARFIPYLDGDALLLLLGRLVPFIVLFGALFALLFQTLPSAYRGKRAPIWPGALAISMLWVTATTLLPLFMSNVTDYDLTYGSLAGAVIALIFFYIIGLAMVAGAQLNAALVNAEQAD